MDFSTFRRRPRWAITGATAVASLAVVAGTAFGVVGDDGFFTPGSKPKTFSEFGQAPLSEAGSEAELLARNAFFMSRRTAGAMPLDTTQAGVLRAEGAKAAKKLKKGHAVSGPTTFDSAWGGLGPNPIVQGLRSPGQFQRFGAMAGRIGAITMRKDGTLLLGGAQGGIWKWTGDRATGVGTWTPLTDGAISLATGALAVAPGNDLVVYAGTGEGHLSGDSYFGNGILKSTDGGNSWNHVSGDYFQGVAVSRLVVDPTNADHVYAAVLRGRGGARRVTPAEHSRFGIWESKDGGVTWTLLREVPEANGATDLEMDPQNPSILYASFWGDAMYKSTDAGQTWTKIMNGIPGTPAEQLANGTRYSMAIAHPAGQGTTLYAGSDWIDGTHKPARVFKSTDGGANWTMLPAGSETTTDNVEDYCTAQCSYDNIIETAPDNPNVVYAGGSFDYPNGTGGMYRSDDGGMTWTDLGYDQHPDFQVFTFDPNNSNRIVYGSDGGVWASQNRGGRLAGPSSPKNDVNWVSLNGQMASPTSTAVGSRTGLQIGQFTSIATVPQIPLRVWGGTQDNGTLRKTGSAAQHWFDTASGDGGMVQVDPTVDTCVLGPSCFVYGTYFNISPWRASDGGNFFTNTRILNGIDLSDRSTFYIPLVLNKDNPNQIFTGTHRVYRADNARTPKAGDVLWHAISPDLTAGCPGTAPNGARSCTLSALGVGGGDAVYSGAEDGHVFMSPNAQTSDDPTWQRLDLTADLERHLPERPVTQFAVDKSNYRIAYIAYAGFNAATPDQPGHLFKTTDGGKHFKNISKSLPDLPVNTVVLDPSYPNTLYVGTDVGAYVTYDGGANWSPLGASLPNVAIWQMDLNTTDTKRFLLAGTHGRGAFRLEDQTAPVPALVVSKLDAGVPVGASSRVDYTLTLRNIGNADATGVTITDPLPDNTSFVSADSGGTLVTDKLGKNPRVVWSSLTVPKAGAFGVPGEVKVHFSVNIANALKSKVKAITNDGIVVTSAQGPGTTGSPFITPIAPPHAVSLAPAAQLDGGRVGTGVDYKLTLTNLGSNADAYTMSTTGGTWNVAFLDSTCTTPLAANTTASVASGGSTVVCARVAVPATAADGATNEASVTATSAADAAVSATGSVKTIAVAVNTLLVDNDTNAPQDSQPVYKAALDAAGVKYQVWDLNVDDNPPLNYMKAFKRMVWFTGNSWPQPLAPYETKLIAYLDAGNNLFMAGQDILDQSGGTTEFAHDYLHIDWDGTETQNDKNANSVFGIAGTLTNGIGEVPLPGTFLGANFENRITPIAPAVAIFTDETAGPDNKRGLSFSGSYKVVFLAFGFEQYGSAADRTEFVNRVNTFFGP